MLLIALVIVAVLALMMVVGASVGLIGWVALPVFAMLCWIAIPVVLIVFGVRLVKRHLLPAARGQEVLPGPAGEVVSAYARRSCPQKERETLRKLERRLAIAHERSVAAIETKLPSELARARVAPALEDAYTQIKNEIASIYAFCERTDLAGTLKKANTSTTAKDIYLEAYERDLAKVQVAIEKTEECLAAYERTIATLEVSSVEADIDSDFDAAIETLRDLRDELPRYNLEDRV